MSRELIRRVALLAGVLTAVIAFFAAPTALVVISTGDFARDLARDESYWGEKLGPLEVYISRKAEPSKAGGVARLVAPDAARWSQQVLPLLESLARAPDGRLFLEPGAVSDGLRALVPALLERHGTAFVREPATGRYLKVLFANRPCSLEPAIPGGVLHPFRTWAAVALGGGLLAYVLIRSRPSAWTAMQFPAGEYVPADFLGAAMVALASGVPLYLADPPSALLTDPELRGPLAMFLAMIAAGVALVAYGASRAAYRLEVLPAALAERTLSGHARIELDQVASAEPVVVGPSWPVILALALLGLGLWPLFILAALLKATRCHGVRLTASARTLVVRTDLEGFDEVWKMLRDRRLVTVEPAAAPHGVEGQATRA